VGCGEGQRGWTAARHAHLPHGSQEVRPLVQGAVPLPGRPVCAPGPGEEVPAQPASVPGPGLCVTAVRADALGGGGEEDEGKSVVFQHDGGGE